MRSNSTRLRRARPGSLDRRVAGKEGIVCRKQLRNLHLFAGSLRAAQAVELLNCVSGRQNPKAERVTIQLTHKQLMPDVASN